MKKMDGSKSVCDGAENETPCDGAAKQNRWQSLMKVSASQNMGLKFIIKEMNCFIDPK